VFRGHKPFGSRLIAAAGHFWESLVSGLPLRADGQLLAAGGPAAGENGLAVCGLHAAPKTVRFGASAVVRLESTFWHCLELPIIHRLGYTQCPRVFLYLRASSIAAASSACVSAKKADPGRESAFFASPEEERGLPPLTKSDQHRLAGHVLFSREFFFDSRGRKRRPARSRHPRLREEIPATVPMKNQFARCL
jgi:hypothetical protein